MSSLSFRKPFLRERERAGVDEKERYFETEKRVMKISEFNKERDEQQRINRRPNLNELADNNVKQ